MCIRDRHRLEVAGEGLDIDPGADLAQAGLLFFSHVEVAAGWPLYTSVAADARSRVDLGGRRDT